MRKVLWITALISVLAVSAAWAEVPMTLTEFTLGQDIKQYESLIDPDTSLPSQDEPFLQEVALVPNIIPGVRIGYLSYGRCADPGKLVRIKLKLSDSSRGLFDQLLKLYRNTWGKPDSYRGDPFQNQVSWKWNFKKDDGSRVTLILSNSRDPEEGLGNNIKMNLRSAWDTERECWKKEHPRKKGKKSTQDQAPVDLNNLVPK